MHLATISTSRADSSALEEMAVIAAEAGHKVTEIKSLRNHPTVGGQLSAASPDVAVIHGDRWDALLAATAATVARVPIVHLGGGDRTEGSYDDRIRDAITKLSRFHLACSYDAHARLLDEHLVRPDEHVAFVGELALAWIDRTELPTQQETLGALNLNGQGERYLLVNWQPETAEKHPNDGLELIFKAMQSVAPRPVVFIQPNDDRGSAEARDMMVGFYELHPNCRIQPNLSREVYAAAMKWCDVMIGNSSSGLIEAPMFGTPFIMVGNRQRGRPVGSNTFMPASEPRLVAHYLNDLAGQPLPRPRSSTNPYWYGHMQRAAVAEALKHVEKALGVTS
jgi:GDP/UDP-N,N'-diacetylbacillosamine 2-epimerase (hydrolysing)